jgi:hypothetical protein
VDAVIIPGGDMAPNVNQTEVFSLVETIYHHGGSGAFVLNEAGLQPVVQSENIITAQGHASYPICNCCGRGAAITFIRASAPVLPGHENLIMLEDQKSESPK